MNCERERLRTWYHIFQTVPTCLGRYCKIIGYHRIFGHEGGYSNIISTTWTPCINSLGLKFLTIMLGISFGLGVS